MTSSSVAESCAKVGVAGNALAMTSATAQTLQTCWGTVADIYIYIRVERRKVNLSSSLLFFGRGFWC